MKILSIDPSLTRTGWCKFVDSKLKSYGAINTSSKQNLIDRLNKLALGVGCLWPEKYDVVLIEVPSGYVAGRHKGAGGHRGAGMSLYGIAVGCVLTTVLSRKENVEIIEENKWTRRVPKKDRQRYITSAYTNYDASKDSGCDVADAIGIVDWWLREKTVAQAV